MNFYLEVEGRRLEHEFRVTRSNRELTAAEIEARRLNDEWRPPLPARLRSLRLPRVARRVPLVRRLA
jgi:hypothetical protein